MLEMLGHGPYTKRVWMIWSWFSLKNLRCLCWLGRRKLLLPCCLQVQASQEDKREMGSRLVPILQAGSLKHLKWKTPDITGTLMVPRQESANILRLMFGSDHEYYLAAWAPEWTCTWKCWRRKHQISWPWMAPGTEQNKDCQGICDPWLPLVGWCFWTKTAARERSWHQISLTGAKAGTLILRVPSLALGANFCSRLAGLWVQKAPGVSG